MFNIISELRVEVLSALQMIRKQADYYLRVILGPIYPVMAGLNFFEREKGI